MLQGHDLVASPCGGRIIDISAIGTGHFYPTPLIHMHFDSSRALFGQRDGRRQCRRASAHDCNFQACCRVPVDDGILRKRVEISRHGGVEEEIKDNFGSVGEHDF